MTPQDFAYKFNLPYTTVIGWIRRGLIKGIQRIAVPRGFVYDVPDSARPPVFTRGRKRRPVREELTNGR